jgi:hypothetical protein
VSVPPLYIKDYSIPTVWKTKESIAYVFSGCKVRCMLAQGFLQVKMVGAGGFASCKAARALAMRRRGRLGGWFYCWG